MSIARHKNENNLTKITNKNIRSLACLSAHTSNIFAKRWLILEDLPNILQTNIEQWWWLSKE